MDELVTIGGRVWVPGNRWDLVTHLVPPDAGSRRVAVIIPYFEQPSSLRRMYAALATADLEDDRYEVVIVDDGSADHPPPPPPADLALPVRRLRQDDRGCRPGAARNFGVRATDAEVLVFLDADTLPGPGTVRRLAAWPAVLPDVLVVGRRGHVDLDGWSPKDTSRWLRGERPGPDPRPDPDWLADGYRETRNLLDADDRSYRYIISSVMSCSRELFDDVGGFDDGRDRYGSEDWDFAARAFNNGAVLVHDPTADAWHDEPDRADRDNDSGDSDGADADRNEEALWLASRVPDPGTRSPAAIHPFPDTIMVVDLAPTVTEGQLVATVLSALEAIPDVSIHVVSPAPAIALDHFRCDPRIVVTPPTPQARLRARAHVTLRAPVCWPESSLPDLLTRIRPGAADVVHVTDDGEPADDGADLVTLAANRAIGRARRASCAGVGADDLRRIIRHMWCRPDAVGATLLTDDVDLQAVFGGWAGPS